MLKVFVSYRQTPLLEEILACKGGWTPRRYLPIEAKAAPSC